MNMACAIIGRTAEKFHIVAQEDVHNELQDHAHQNTFLIGLSFASTGMVCTIRRLQSR